MSAGTGSNISNISSTPTYTESCPNLSPEVIAVLQATVQALTTRICDGDQAQAQFTNDQVQALQGQINLLSGSTDLAQLEATVSTIMALVDPDGDGTLDQLFAPLQQAIDSANAAATAAQMAATTAQQTATAAQQTAAAAQTAANTAQTAASAAQQAATGAQNDVDALEDLVAEVVSDVNDGFANMQAAHCAEKAALQGALQEFVNVTLPQLINAPCEMPAPVVGPGSGENSSEGDNAETTDPAQLI